MPMVSLPSHELPEPRIMEHRLLAVRAKDKMASASSSHNCFCGHWHIRAVTAQCANELEAVS
jgi:hypothetical protein